MSMLNKKTIEDIEVNGLKVIARVDFNVPIDENGKITDDKRIRGALPTIGYLIKNKATMVIKTEPTAPIIIRLILSFGFQFTFSRY